MLGLLLALLPQPTPVAPPPRELYFWYDYSTGEGGWYARESWKDGVLTRSIHEADIEFSYVLPRADLLGELP